MRRRTSLASRLRIEFHTRPPGALGCLWRDLVKTLRLAALPLLLLVHVFAADTALDRYVKKPDATYKYEVVSTTKSEGYTTYVVDLTSQTWRTPAEIDRTVWKHWMTIVKPDKV